MVERRTSYDKDSNAVSDVCGRSCGYGGRLFGAGIFRAWSAVLESVRERYYGRDYKRLYEGAFCTCNA